MCVARSQVLHRVFRGPMASGNIRQRECVAVWLMSVLRYCPKAVQGDLMHIQQAASLLLSDPSALTRECSSRVLLYSWEAGTEADRAALLAALMRDMESKQGDSLKVDRSVFPDDALRTPKLVAPTESATAGATGAAATAAAAAAAAAAGSGKESVKQLAGVAKTVSSSLTPSLLSLASDSSILSSSRGRASAFDADSNRLIKAARSQLFAAPPCRVSCYYPRIVLELAMRVLSHCLSLFVFFFLRARCVLLTLKSSRSRLLPHLEKIFPSLFRGQFFPDPYVGQSMGRILRALASEDTAAEGRSTRVTGTEQTLAKFLTQYFGQTCDFVLAGMKDRDWNVREASVVSLSELVAGRSWLELSDFFVDCWKMVLSGLDDMRESVRTAAGRSLKSLQLVTCRFVDSDHTAEHEAQVALEQVVGQV